MKSFTAVTLCCLSLGILPSLKANTIADWTFETSIPEGFTGPGEWFTNVSAEVGVGTASALLSMGGPFSPFPGNGSQFAFGVTNGWSQGDFFQFAVSTIGLKNISISYDQSGTSGGPGTFVLEYSTDGNSFTKFGSDYAVQIGNWNNSVRNPNTSYSFDLSSISALNNQSTIYLRVVNDSNLSIDGNPLDPAIYSDDRVDNVLITGAPVPEPSMLAFAALAVGSGLVLRRKRG